MRILEDLAPLLAASLYSLSLMLMAASSLDTHGRKLLLCARPGRAVDRDNQSRNPRVAYVGEGLLRPFQARLCITHARQLHRHHLLEVGHYPRWLRMLRTRDLRGTVPAVDVTLDVTA